MSELRERATERVGTILRDKWTLDALLGVGGMGAVYAATHRNRSRVAIKILHDELVAYPQFVERFLREGYAANRIGHDSVVAVLDDDRTDVGTPFLVMELLDGVPLDKLVDERGPLPPSEVTRLGILILDVLAAAHDAGVIHRDIKPENLVWMRDGSVKVLDFGIARLREAPSTSTIAGQAMGTPSFMAPEQARGHWAHVDAQSDVFAVGATMYSVLTGRRLREAPTPNEALLLAMTTPAPPMARLLPALHPALGSIIDRALAFDKSARWPSARAMQDALAGMPALTVTDPLFSTTLPLSDICQPTSSASVATYRSLPAPPPEGPVVSRKVIFSVLAGIVLGASVLGFVAGAGHSAGAKMATSGAFGTLVIPAMHDERPIEKVVPPVEPATKERVSAATVIAPPTPPPTSSVKRSAKAAPSFDPFDRRN